MINNTIINVASPRRKPGPCSRMAPGNCARCSCLPFGDLCYGNDSMRQSFLFGFDLATRRLLVEPAGRLYLSLWNLNSLLAEVFGKEQIC